MWLPKENEIKHKCRAQWHQFSLRGWTRGNYPSSHGYGDTPLKEFSESSELSALGGSICPEFWCTLLLYFSPLPNAPPEVRIKWRFSQWGLQVAPVVTNLSANAGDARDSGLILGWQISPGATPVLLPESHGQRILVGQSLDFAREADADWSQT